MKSACFYKNARSSFFIGNVSAFGHESAFSMDKMAIPPAKYSKYLLTVGGGILTILMDKDVYF